METQLPLPKKGRAPNFRPCLLWQNGWMDQDATWYESRPRLRRHCVRWGPSSSSKRAHRQLSAHVYCGQTAGSIKMPLVREVGLGSGDIVLDGDRALAKKGAQPNYRPMYIVAKRLNASVYRLVQGRPQPRRHCVGWGPSSAPTPIKGAQPPQLSADVYCGQTVAHLSYC